MFSTMGQIKNLCYFVVYVAVYNRKYDRTLGSKADVLRAFAKLDTPLEHDKYLEALHCEYN